MNWKLVYEVGFKILTAAVAGTVVFVGISKAMTEGGAGKKSQNPEPEPGPMNRPEGSGCVFDPCQPPMQNKPQRNEPVVLKSMRATQDSCGKLFAFIQSLTMVTENLTRIFGGNTQSESQMYYQNPWSYRQPVTGNNGQTIFTRVSPFIIEAGPVPNSRLYPGY